MRVAGQRNVTEGLYRMHKHVVVYVSPTDKALGAADWLFASKNRLGKLRPERLDEEQRLRLRALNNGEVVDSRVRAKGAKHAYFVDHPATFSDLILVLRYNRPVGAEHGRPLTEIAPRWYIIDDDYPREAAPLPKSLRGQ